MVGCRCRCLYFVDNQGELGVNEVNRGGLEIPDCEVRKVRGQNPENLYDSQYCLLHGLLLLHDLNSHRDCRHRLALISSWDPCHAAPLYLLVFSSP